MYDRVPVLKTLETKKRWVGVVQIRKGKEFPMQNYRVLIIETVHWKEQFLCVKSQSYENYDNFQHYECPYHHTILGISVAYELIRVRAKFKNKAKYLSYKFNLSIQYFLLLIFSHIAHSLLHPSTLRPIIAQEHIYNLLSFHLSLLSSTLTLTWL